MRKTVGFVAVIPFLACIGSTEPQVGEEFSLSVGQGVRVAGTALSVDFVGVSEDSRCPSDVDCVWAGNGAVVVKTSISSTGEASDTLNTLLEPKVVHLGNVQLELLALTPNPRTDVEISTDSYSAIFVTRRIP